MSRSGSPSGFNQADVRPFFAVKLEFDSGTLRFWNGYQPITIDSESYQGAGSLISISPIEETSEIKAAGTSIVLQGLSTDIISLALSESYQNRNATIYTGTVTEDLTVSAYQAFKGLMDTMQIAENGSTARVELNLENRLITLERPRILRYTSEEQKTLFPGDLGLEFIDDIQDRTIEWGKSSAQT